MVTRWNLVIKARTASSVGVSVILYILPHLRGKSSGSILYSMEETNIELLDKELAAVQIIKLYTFLQDHPDYSKREACTELGLSYDSTLRWIREGVLTEYLERTHDVRSDVAQVTALNELQSIVLYQAKIARGEVLPRGANPTAAAQFVLQIATLGARAEQRTAGNLHQINIYVPEMKETGTSVIDVPAHSGED